MEYDSYMRAILALMLVVGLIGLVSFMLKRFQFEGRLMKKVGGNKRIEVVEMKPIGTRRQLVLVRRDDVEHLILLGQSSEIVVESGIKTAEKA